MTALRIILVLLGAILIIATALPHVRTDEWWVRIFDFPRLQIAALLAAVLLVSLVVVDAARAPGLLFLLALLLSLVDQASRIFPYTPMAAPQVRDDPSCAPESRIRLLTANVLMGNRRADDFLAMVRATEPDVVLAVETDRWWDQQLAALDRRYPFSVKYPLDNTYGMHLFSRLELTSPEVRFLVEPDVPSIRTAVRLRSGAEIDFHGVHPRPPRPGQDTGERDAELLIVGKEIKAEGRPAIVAGDLNDVAWSRTTKLFQRISGTLDPRIGRGPYNTFPAQYPGFRWALDHVFHEASFTLVEMRRLAGFGSDHFPILVELCHRPRAAAEQEAPRAAPRHREEAAEKIEDASGGGSGRAPREPPAATGRGPRRR